MALFTTAPFKRGGAFPIDEDLVKSKADMLTVDDNTMPDAYLCVCKDDGKLYLYDKTNTSDPETGKYRVFESGGGVVDVELTKAQYDALSEAEKMNGTNYFITDWNAGGGGSQSGETPDLDAVLTKGYTSNKTIVLETGDATTTGISDNALSPHLIQLRAYGSLSAGRVFTGSQLYPDSMAISTTVEKTGSTEKNEGFLLRIRPNLANDRIDTIVSMTDSVKQAFRTALGITDELILESPNGTKYKLKVADDGALSTEVI